MATTLDGLGTRSAGNVGDEHWSLNVVHEWATEDCKEPDCPNRDADGHHHDPGVVRLLLFNHDDAVGDVILTPGQALVLTEMIRKATGWALESFEEAPDYERESKKWQHGRKEG